MRHGVSVPADTVEGTREVIIKDGKSLVEVREKAWSVWKSYERRVMRGSEGCRRGSMR